MDSSGFVDDELLFVLLRDRAGSRHGENGALYHHTPPYSQPSERKYAAPSHNGAARIRVTQTGG